MELNESKEMQIRETEKIKNEEKEKHYKIRYIRKFNCFYFTATRDREEFATKSMTYDEAHKIISNNNLRHHNYLPKKILKTAKNSLSNGIEVTGTIQEPIFFETLSC